MKKLFQISLFILALILLVFIILSVRKYIYITKFINRVNSYSSMDNLSLSVIDTSSPNDKITFYKFENISLYKQNNKTIYKDTDNTYYFENDELEDDTTSDYSKIIEKTNILLPSIDLNNFWNRLKLSTSFDTNIITHTYNNVNCYKFTFINYDKNNPTAIYTVYLNMETFDPIFIQINSNNYEYNISENTVTNEDIKIPEI